MSIPTITVNGTFRDAAGDPMSGYLSFRLNSKLVDSVGNIVSERVEIRSTLDSQGRLTDTNGTTVGLVLYCTSGGDIAPDGLLYDVKVEIGTKPHRVQVALPSTLGATVDWADIVPVPSSTGVVWTVPDLTAEQARDLVGTTLVATSPLSSTVDDPGDTVTVAIDLAAAAANAAFTGTYQPLAARLTTLAGRTDATEAAALRTAALDAAYDAAGAASTEQTRALAAEALLAPLASPALTGNPTAPTQAAGNNSTRLATTAYADAAIAALIGTAPGVLDTLGEISDAINDDANLYTTLTAAINAKVADAINDGTTTVAPSQNAVFDALALKAPLASPALTGSPTAPTQSAADNSTKIATTAYADAKVADAITDGVTGVAPSQNAVFDGLATKVTSSVSAKQTIGNGGDPNLALTQNVSLLTTQAVVNPSNTIMQHRVGYSLYTGAPSGSQGTLQGGSDEAHAFASGTSMAAVSVLGFEGIGSADSDNSKAVGTVLGIVGSAFVQNSVAVTKLVAIRASGPHSSGTFTGSVTTAYSLEVIEPTVGTTKTSIFSTGTARFKKGTATNALEVANASDILQWASNGSTIIGYASNGTSARMTLDPGDTPTERYLSLLFGSGNHITFKNSGSEVFSVLYDGTVNIGGATTTTAPAAGGAGALPATPLGYVTIKIAGSSRKVAYY